MSSVFDSRVCELGEGPLWHPEREQLFWFDILGNKLMTQVNGDPREWEFDEHVSAAGWVDVDTLILASETALWKFTISSGEQEYLVALEADNPVTRSNDGRADPFGGFWIGTMGKNAEAKAGAIYRYYKGELRKLVADVTITNAICFSADGKWAHYADTLTGQVMRWEMDPDGWPVGEAFVHVDTKAEGLNPDGAVVDADGTIWIAQWGASRVAAYDGSGQFVRAVEFGGRHTSCPAFGGADLTTLFCTTAAEGLSADVLETEPENGMVFVEDAVAQGQAENKVIL
ncbi:SMP-30/gluconolactonase/LRE family protein [Shimia sp. Alg240-R146]|uniref:SMP-30/gluconolactonase/LRE family protein n=1 Tax=Shimia sp. Alg240-R146 TaxID=2993449 RepID=UPI0022E10D34|nr:SMP-30/gluconolactonase/LRE family protein [Shimia sp. Alg240-R146]